MYSEILYDIFHLIFFSGSLWAETWKNRTKKLQVLKDIPKFVLIVLSALLKKCFELWNIILLLVFIQYYWAHIAFAIVGIFCQCFNYTIDIVVKCLHIFIKSLLPFSTKLFIKSLLHRILLRGPSSNLAFFIYQPIFLKFAHNLWNRIKNQFLLKD